MTPAQFPAREKLIDANGLLSQRWMRWMRDLRQDVTTSPRQSATPVQLTGLSASIGITAIPTDPLSPGLYRVTSFLRVTTPGSVSSSLTLSISFTRNATTCTYAGSALTANNVMTPQSLTWLLWIDGGSPISYAVAYAATAPSSMTYEMALTLEEVST